MTKIEKLIEKFCENPGSISYNDLDLILLYSGYHKIQWAWSHVLYKKSWCENIAVPVHNNDCKIVYKQRCKKLLYPNQQNG